MTRLEKKIRELVFLSGRDGVPVSALCLAVSDWAYPEEVREAVAGMSWAAVGSEEIVYELGGLVYACS